MKFEFPGSVRSDFNGYEIFLKLYNEACNLFLENVILDFKRTTWFEANLTAVLGAVSSNIESDLVEVVMENVSGDLESLFKRNHFSGYFGDYQLVDAYGTTISYKVFKTNEEKSFKNYIDDELLSKSDMPAMSEALRKEINKSIFEIFNNADAHGNCDRIFSCGQYYPKKKRLDFTIVDIGTTIQDNVSKFMRQTMSGVDCIKWAVQKGTTTKQKNIPGGLGLSLIREFLKMNKGRIQIISSDGYWEQNQEKAMTKSFTQRFPGTIVNLEFNLNDKQRYFLASEINENEIF